MPAERVHAGLAPALPGADWRQVGDTIVEGLTDALDLKARSCSLEPVPARYLEPYKASRWSPVAAAGWTGGIPNS